MKIFKILNWLSAILFLSLWIWLFIARDSYRGSGLSGISNLQNKNHFQKENPFIFQDRDSLFGFYSNPKNQQLEGIWFLPTDSLKKINYLPFPKEEPLEKIIAVSKDQNNKWYFAGLHNDSVIKIFKLDTLFHFYKTHTISHLEMVKGFAIAKGAPELVLGKTAQQLGTILRFTDTTVSARKYELPSFFDRICRIELAFHNKKQWQFLLSSDYYQRDTVWIRYDTSHFANTLLFDEKAIYPTYPGRPQVSRSFLAATINKRPFGLMFSPLKSALYFEFTKNTLQKKEFPFPITKTSAPFFIYHYDTIKNIFTVDYSLEQKTENGQSSWSLYTGGKKALPLLKTNDYQYIESSDETGPDIKMNHLDSIVGICKLSADSFIVLTQQFQIAIIDSNGVLKSQNHFFKMLHSQIIKHNPGNVLLMDIKILPYRAIIWYIILMGPFLWWLLSALCIWLFGLFHKKPTYYSRRKKKVYPSKIIFWGSLAYLFLYSIFIANFLVSMNLV